MEIEKYSKKREYHWIDIGRRPRTSNACVRARYQFCIDLLKSRLDPSKKVRVLDLGCGDGALTYLLWKEGYKPEAIDTSSLGVRLAIEQHKKYNTSCSFQCCEASTIADGEYDAVICSDVIEHVESPENLIYETLIILRPGGIAVFSTPIRLTENLMDKEHIQEWWPSQWKELFRNENNAVFSIFHPVAIMEMINKIYLRILVNLLSNFVDLFSKKRFWNILELQYAVIAKTN
jgi:2-polyprenyl-3-methyl-5-hydroxy-6-metoxy-1,4-benzoquinol methylase